MRKILVASILAASMLEFVQADDLIGRIPSEEECLGLMAVLPTFESEGMRKYYERNPAATGKELVLKLKSLADGGDNAAQFTLGVLLLEGYCVPQDVCAALRFRNLSLEGKADWSRRYPMAQWPKVEEARCK